MKAVNKFLSQNVQNTGGILEVVAFFGNTIHLGFSDSDDGTRVLLCIVVYYCVLLCIIVYCCVLVCIIVYYCVLLCIVVYYCVLLCIVVVFSCVVTRNVQVGERLRAEVHTLRTRLKEHVGSGCQV